MHHVNKCPKDLKKKKEGGWEGGEGGGGGGGGGRGGGGGKEPEKIKISCIDISIETAVLSNIS